MWCDGRRLGCSHELRPGLQDLHKKVVGSAYDRRAEVGVGSRKFHDIASRRGDLYSNRIEHLHRNIIIADNQPQYCCSRILQNSLPETDFTQPIPRSLYRAHSLSKRDRHTVICSPLTHPPSGPSHNLIRAQRQSGNLAQLRCDTAFTGWVTSRLMTRPTARR